MRLALVSRAGHLQPEEIQLCSQEQGAYISFSDKGGPLMAQGIARRSRYSGLTKKKVLEQRNSFRRRLPKDYLDNDTASNESNDTMPSQNEKATSKGVEQLWQW